MDNFLKRISSRKFLTTLAVQIAAVAALFRPEQAGELQTAAVRLAALVTLLLAAFGYGRIEAALDQHHRPAEPRARDDDRPRA